MQNMSHCVVVDLACFGNYHRLQIVDEVVINYGNSIMMVNKLVTIAHNFAWCWCSFCGLVWLEQFLLAWHLDRFRCFRVLAF